MMAPATRLIALDWGSSSLRAYRLGDGGSVLEVRSTADGASRLIGGAPAFVAALVAVVGDWLLAAHDAPIIACGMVGSAHGWREAAYCPCPATADDIAAQAVRVELSAGIAHGRPLLIVPGVSHRPAGAAPDVMRGEETQVMGALAAAPPPAGRACFVLPGTHSKWVHVEGGRIESFHSAMTGELFALLREHSVLARSMAPPAAAAGEPDLEALRRGVRAAAAAPVPDLARQLFGVRAMGLLGELAPGAAADYLSGLLIGHELRAGLAGSHAVTAPITLVGDAALCARYATAFDVLGVNTAIAAPDAAASGLWTLARSGLRRHLG